MLLGPKISAKRPSLPTTNVGSHWKNSFFREQNGFTMFAPSATCSTITSKRFSRKHQVKAKHQAEAICLYRSNAVICHRKNRLNSALGSFRALLQQPLSTVAGQPQVFKARGVHNRHRIFGGRLIHVCDSLRKRAVR